MALVRLEGVSKVYEGGVRAVDSVNLTVADGEFVVLVGPSGCGKSTTLRMVAGLEDATGGTITIGDRVVNDVPPQDRDIAMVFQNYALYPHLTVGQNLAFGLERRRKVKGVLRSIWDPSHRRARAEESEAIASRVASAAKTLGISSLLERAPRELSGGQRQRVAVGRAMVRNPAVFLFDEPLSNLDALMRGEMRTELRILHRQLRSTMIYVTHDQEEAMSLADRMVVMKDGIVQQIGTPMEIYERPANRFVAGFIGTPPMNMIPGRLSRAGDRVTFNSGILSLELPAALVGAFREPQQGSEATLGVRPDRLTVATGPAVAGEIIGTIVSIERYGSLTDLIVQAESSRLSVRSSAGALGALTERTQVRLRVDPAGVHLFP